MKKQCYNIDLKCITIGMVLFVIVKDKIILDKIWFKDEKSIKKEREILKNLRNGKTKIFLKNLTKVV